ncbi:dihydroneopterin aldolase [Gemella sp. GH3]|uniref:dihydroneopterin aldolase n=1 Tax=unclassified Gemella TaxID=2624949 RepID=UPI0015D026F1|nr:MULTISPECIES: dihydroneopterin aldolase [unclassified Gemella]MBF0713556.1 dihydroneopterin aldolase [Gemella sp. GH3.1]NYS50508.1 dihydroneopterin aldolase [Gemella sp. GH3]
MKNCIYINGLELYAYHGVFSEENKLGQRFVFDISCELNYTDAMVTDNLNSSVSYADIANVVFDVATSDKYNLLEKLSFEILKKIFDKYKEIQKIKLKINKPNAPIDKVFISCGTEVEFDRYEFYEVFKL